MSFILSPTASTSSAPLVLPIRAIPASIPRSDVLVCDVPSSPILRTFPLSPFPMYRGQPLLMHCFGSPEPPDPAISPIVAARHAREGTAAAPPPLRDPVGWPAAGLGWRRWVSGEMLGYRNSQWQEVEVSRAGLGQADQAAGDFLCAAIHPCFAATHAGVIRRSDRRCCIGQRCRDDFWPENG